MINVNSILTASGIPSKKTKFQSPPKNASYAVWFDGVTLVGPDMRPAMLRQHDITIRVYEYKPDEAAETALEAALDAADVAWDRSDRDWLQEEQLYLTTYTFTFFEKRS
jgi:hypothetical protein